MIVTCEWTALWEIAVGEWRRNTRLRLGAALAGLILAGYGVLTLSDLEPSLRAEHQRLRQQLAVAENLATQNYWGERRDAAKAVRVQLESRLWSATSRGLAQADVQTWLNAQLKAAQFGETRTQVEQAREVEGQPGLWQVTARVEGSFAANGLLVLLRAIETHERLTVVEQLEALDGRQARFQLLVTAYFRTLS